MADKLPRYDEWLGNYGNPGGNSDEIILVFYAEDGEMIDWVNASLKLPVAIPPQAKTIEMQ